jgi:hypothetical protein
MATLLASKTARVRRHVGHIVPHFTDRDYRHLVHACAESPRRAIRAVKAGEHQALVDGWVNGAAVEAAPAPAPAPTPAVAKGKGKKSLGELAAQLQH